MSNIIDVVWYGNPEKTEYRVWWDLGILSDIFSNKIWQTGYEFRHYDGIDSLPADSHGAVAVVPARLWVGKEEEINNQLQKLDFALLMLAGDEESLFAVEKITTPNTRIWVMSPKIGRHDSYGKLGSGYPLHLHEYMPLNAPNKVMDYFFAGQVVNNKRREECAAALELIKEDAKWNNLEGEYLLTKGFTQGDPPTQFYTKMLSAKTGPAPSGPCTHDSFRLFELLECGTVPIADDIVASGEAQKYWTWFFGEEPPFPSLNNYEDLATYIKVVTDDYPRYNNKVMAWWLDKKREMAITIGNQIQEISGIMPEQQNITVVVSSSPIKSHPSTEIIEQTIHDIRVHLPKSEIIIMQDGIRAEDEPKREAYEEYQRKLLWLVGHAWNNIRVISFKEHKHQSGMLRDVLPQITTPLMLFNEHDTPLTPDMPIEWDNLSQAILTGQANVIRLHHEKLVLPEHGHLMISGVEDVCGAKMRKSIQWSQRPHLASVAFYKHMLSTYFSEESKAFIEDRIYGKCLESYDIDGMMGWNLWKLWVYHPDGGNIQRSYDLDGRGGEKKYDDKQVF